MRFIVGYLGNFNCPFANGWCKIGSEWLIKIRLYKISVPNEAKLNPPCLDDNLALEKTQRAVGQHKKYEIHS